MSWWQDAAGSRGCCYVGIEQSVCTWIDRRVIQMLEFFDLATSCWFTRCVPFHSTCTCWFFLICAVHLAFAATIWLLLISHATVPWIWLSSNFSSPRKIPPRIYFVLLSVRQLDLYFLVCSVLLVRQFNLVTAAASQPSGNRNRSRATDWPCALSIYKRCATIISSICQNLVSYSFYLIHRCSGDSSISAVLLHHHFALCNATRATFRARIISS